jgi:hypothetical protein
MQSSHPKVDNIVSLVPLLEEQKLIIEMQNGFRHVWMFSGKIDSDLKLKFIAFGFYNWFLAKIKYT